MELRCLLLLPLDDLVALVREFLHPHVSRAGLDRCLRRHGVANLRELQAKALADAGTDAERPLKTFKDYEPGFVHVDIGAICSLPSTAPRVGCSYTSMRIKARTAAWTSSIAWSVQRP